MAKLAHSNRFCKHISEIVCSSNLFHFDSPFGTNKVITNIYVFSPVMVYLVFSQTNGTHAITKNNYLVLRETKIFNQTFQPNSLHDCLLKFDFSLIGDLFNLEVLILANCGIQIVPSIIGNLKKLKLLDLTGCKHLRIDNGVFKKLVNLEELYMIDLDYWGISFTYDKYNELAQCSKNLSTLDQLKNMSYEKLERFRISLGRDIARTKSGINSSFENTLDLSTNKSELIESGMYELFEKTEELWFSVDGMNHLGDVDGKMKVNSFYNLRVLTITGCDQFGYIFTYHQATTLSKLEHLNISSCKNMQELVHFENNEEKMIAFLELKVLSLAELPKLSSLCNNVNVIELPKFVELILDRLSNVTCIFPKNNVAISSMSGDTSEIRTFLNQAVGVIPKLEKLHLSYMENLKEIWPCQFNSDDINVSMLREIRVENCSSLVNLFPTNPMPFLHHLEDVKVESCGSIEVSFNIDLGFTVKPEQVTSSLRNIKVIGLKKLTEVWRIKGVHNSHNVIHGFQTVKSILIRECWSFRNIFTPMTKNFDLQAVMNIDIIDCGEYGRNNELAKNSQKQQVDVISKEETYEVIDNNSNVAFPSYLIHTFPHLHNIVLSSYKGVEVVFEIESSDTSKCVTPQTTRQTQLLSFLENIKLHDMESMSHVWKCNWKEFFILHRQMPESSFHNLTTIEMRNCKSIKYLFSPLMAKLLSNLKEISISRCDGMEVVVSTIDDQDEERTTYISGHTGTTSLFPRLDSLYFDRLKNLKHIGSGGVLEHNVFCL